MKTLVIALCVMMLCGCSTVMKYVMPAADVGVAAASIGPCRAELDSYLPLAERSMIADDLELLDGIAGRLALAVETRGESVTFESAMSATADIAGTKTEIEAAFKRVNDVTVEYGITGGKNSRLLQCRDQIEKGWKVITRNSGAVRAAEVLAAIRPYARLLPLLLKVEGEKGVA